ncbi:MAG: O-antigen ligase family protein [Candidatus Omnitrophota bacterium]
MLLSPELEIGSTAGRQIIIRAEDLLLILVSFTWLAKMAIRKELPVIVRSPLNAPIGLYVAVLCVSTLRGMLLGNVPPLKGTFFVLKLVEYFILYFMVFNNTNTTKQVKLFVAVLFITSIIVGIYGITHIGRVDRISAPFEGSGEPNTLGGYLLFILCILLGLILHHKERRNVLILIFLFLVPTFIFTVSRASFLGMFIALPVFIFLTKRKNVFNAVVILIVAFILLVAFGPPIMKRRVLGIFQPEEKQTLKRVGVITLGPSPAARVESWHDILVNRFPKKPLLGYGMTGGPFLDSQYILAISETGLVGLCLFLWLMWRIWNSAFKVYQTVETPLFKGLAVGFLVGFAGLLGQAIGTNTFIIIRIAEPFWFFAAITLKLKDIETGKAVEEQTPYRSPWY